MALWAQTSYYHLPPGYRAERTAGMLVLRRPDGSVAVELCGQRAIGEILERHAWEDSEAERKRRVEGGYGRLLELPAPVVLGVLWLAGAVPVGLGAVALYALWSMLRAVAGG